MHFHLLYLWREENLIWSWCSRIRLFLDDGGWTIQRLPNEKLSWNSIPFNERSLKNEEIPMLILIASVWYICIHFLVSQNKVVGRVKTRCDQRFSWPPTFMNFGTMVFSKDWPDPSIKSCYWNEASANCSHRHRAAFKTQNHRSKDTLDD